MAGTVGGAGNNNTPSPLTDQAQAQGQTGNTGSQKVTPAEVPNQLNSLNPNNTSQTPIGERSSTPVDGKPTPGLSRSSEEKDLPALEQEREDMLKEAGELMQKNEELTVLGFALRSLMPENYDKKLDPPPGLKVTLQMAPDAPVYTIEPPDEAFKKLPKEQRSQMKKMAYGLLMNHAANSYKSVNPQANNERIKELREKLEKNGEAIGRKNGDNNWRDRLKKLEHRPAHIVINGDDGATASATEPKQKDKPQPKVTVTSEPAPPVETGDKEPPVSIGKITLVTGDITQLNDQWGLQVDAIANAANESLSEGGGVCGDIFKAAGSGKKNLEEECRELGTCPTGEARTTGAYDLSSQGVTHIIHAVAPDRGKPEYSGNVTQTSLTLNRSYQSIMEEAEKLNLKKVAIPLLGTGSFKVDPLWSAESAASTIARYQEKHPDAPEVIFVVYPGTQSSDCSSQDIRRCLENELTKRSRNQSKE